MSSVQILYAQTANDSVKIYQADAINFNLLQSLVGGEVRLTFEKPLIKNKSIEFGFGYIYRYLEVIGGDLDINYYGPFEYYGFSVRSGIKYYTSKTKDHEGYYYNPILLYRYLYHKAYIDNYQPAYYYIANINIFCGQMLYGYKFHLTSRFLIDFYGGIGLRYILDFQHETLPNALPLNNPLTLFIPTLQTGFTIDFLLK